MSPLCSIRAKCNETAKRETVTKDVIVSSVETLEIFKKHTFPETFLNQKIIRFTELWN
jgi:hypothetical protein